MPLMWCCSVKRHGYPIGGMRSESPVKKQAATEEMHMEVCCERQANDWCLACKAANIQNGQMLPIAAQ